MTEKDRILQTITDETKSSVNSMKVVTPSIYASIFQKFSKSYDTEIENEVELSHNLLDEQCATFTTMQDKTTQNVKHLSESTEKAITAIHDKDESALNEVLKETQELRDEIEALKTAVYKDELTNVYNRKWLHDNILNADKNFKESGCLAMIDLNYFKIVNDTFGHVIGDKVLMLIANALKKSSFDVIRYGGDEFIIIFPKSSDEAAAFKALADIREDILKKKLRAQDSVFRTSFSIGVSSYTSSDKLNTILESADKNMYEDKLKIKQRITGITV